MSDLRATYDPEARAAYVYVKEPDVPNLGHGPGRRDPDVAATVKVDASVMLDFDETGYLVGIEILLPHGQEIEGAEIRA